MLCTNCCDHRLGFLTLGAVLLKRRYIFRVTDQNGIGVKKPYNFIFTDFVALFRKKSEPEFEMDELGSGKALEAD